MPRMARVHSDYDPGVALTLEVPSMAAIRRMWARRMGIDVDVDPLAEAGVAYLNWTGTSAAVVLRLGEAVVVAAPESAHPALRRLSADQLLQGELLLLALEFSRPTLIGTAQLAYADVSTFTPSTTGTTRRADRADIESVTSRCTGSEAEESGLLQMDARFVVEGDETAPIAAAGYELWGDDVAHLGLAVAPAHRGKGLGQVAATAAGLHALEDGAVLQWRSGESNAASARTGERLGFVALGTQIAVDLTDMPK